MRQSALRTTRAELLVGRIVGAQRITVGEQGGRAIQIEQRRVGQQRGMTGRGQFFIHQKIAVAVHDEDARALCVQRAQRVADGLVERLVEIVVARPILEQVAQDVERLGLRCSCRRKSQEQFRAMRMLAAQMQVGDE